METINKKTLSERDICTKYITPAIVQAGWNLFNQIQEEVTFTKGRVMVKGRICSRGESKRTDWDGMQQALLYAEMMDVPFVYSTNGMRL